MLRIQCRRYLTNRQSEPFHLQVIKTYCISRVIPLHRVMNIQLRICLRTTRAERRLTSIRNKLILIICLMMMIMMMMWGCTTVMTALRRRKCFFMMIRRRMKCECCTRGMKRRVAVLRNIAMCINRWIYMYRRYRKCLRRGMWRMRCVIGLVGMS